MANIWDKFDKEMDVTGLKEDVKTAAEKGSDFPEVPIGDYEVSITKLELGETKKEHKPALICWFKILAGDYKGSILFMTQVLTTGFGIHKANEFLRSLDTDIDVEFDTYRQYGELIMDIREKVDEKKLEYAIKYGEKNNFKTFEITEVFEAE